MWSPVDDKNKVLIIVTSSKKHNPQEDRNKMKLPAFFQMDSGSSYESTEHHDANKAPVKPEKNNHVPFHQSVPHPCMPHPPPLRYIPQPPDNTLPRREWLTSFNSLMPNKTQSASPRRYYDLSPKAEATLEHKASRHSWVMGNMKSHSLDSSFDDQSTYSLQTKISTASSGTFLNQSFFNSSYSNAHMMLSGQERRKRFMQQQMDKSFERRDLLAAPPSPGHLFYAYNQMTKHLDRRPLRPADVLSRETSERLRISNEEIKNMRLKEKSPEANFKYSRCIMSPRSRNNLLTGDKRSTFSQQKSFSYDVPSMQPKRDLQWRKQSEPTVSSINRMHLSRNRLTPDNSEGITHVLKPQMSQPFSLHPPPFNQSMQLPRYPLNPFNPRHEKPPNKDAFYAKRQTYCTQRSQSCETGHRAPVDTNRPSVSEQTLNNSLISKRDYLGQKEMRNIQMNSTGFLRPISQQHSHPHSISNLITKRNQFSCQKSQSCEISQASYLLANNLVKSSPRELKTYLGYPRLYRQLAKSDMEVEPIYEKDSSNSSKEVPEPPKTAYHTDVPKTAYHTDAFSEEGVFGEVKLGDEKSCLNKFNRKLISMGKNESDGYLAEGFGQASKHAHNNVDYSLLKAKDTGNAHDKWLDVQKERHLSRR